MISTHILDTSIGKPAAGVSVQLEYLENAEWIVLDTQETNTDGRISFNCLSRKGDYRIVFKIEDYFSMVDSFFLETPVVFRILDITRNYHVPLLLNPFGYSTYRGS